MLLSACSETEQPAFVQSSNVHPVYVVSQGWHTGLVLSSACLPDTLWPSGYRFDEYPYLQIGWGDLDFYSNEGFNLWYAVKAAVWPTPSGLQVVGLHKLSNLQYYAAETVRLELDQASYQQICQFIQAEFALDSSGHFIPGKEGLFGESRFFLGERAYYFPRNSNVWTARALKQAGMDISPIWYQTQGSLMRRIKEEGELLYSDKPQ
jgi:uncharacterized protein (TIGR02117 family)